MLKKCIIFADVRIKFALFELLKQLFNQKRRIYRLMLQF